MVSKKIFSFIVSVLLICQTFGQKLNDSTITQLEIMGIWQYKTSVISSTLHQNFQFFKNGKFIYNRDGYDDLNPLMSIFGIYTIEHGILNLRIIQYKWQVGFKVAEADHGFQFGSFQLIDGKSVIVEQNDILSSPHDISIVDKNVTMPKIIKIDGDKYYKLSDDPDKFVTK
jgi:hypothetical protein